MPISERMWCSANHHTAVAAALFGLLIALPVRAGNQIYEPMAASVQSQLQGAVADQAHPRLVFDTPEQAEHWIAEMSKRLRRYLPDEHYRREFLTSVQYEAKRAGLDPQLVLGIIDIESKFRKYAVSSAGARGYMQVMPFWRKVIGNSDHNLFHMRTNLRYGCLILRHYLDIERGNLVRALGRYNGSLGRMEYPNLVMAAWKRWAYRYKPNQVSSRPPPLNYRGASE